MKRMYLRREMPQHGSLSYDDPMATTSDDLKSRCLHTLSGNLKEFKIKGKDTFKGSVPFGYAGP